jgi:membrane protein implicated in regulation of membrane protease activity
MFKNIVEHPITTWSGLVVFLVGCGLLYLGKITWEQFLIFVALAGIGAFSQDPGKGDSK